jgi:NAD(P)-dependent dehydrogenase (short-subunit alcohol dehydrogenase family)
MIAGSSAAGHPTTALVTGGASGIGLATAHALGITGTTVYIPPELARRATERPDGANPHPIVA